jgi:hypothetical protein
MTSPSSPSSPASVERRDVINHPLSGGTLSPLSGGSASVRAAAWARASRASFERSCSYKSSAASEEAISAAVGATPRSSLWSMSNRILVARRSAPAHLSTSCAMTISRLVSPAAHPVFDDHHRRVERAPQHCRQIFRFARAAPRVGVVPLFEAAPDGRFPISNLVVARSVRRHRSPPPGPSVGQRL